MTVRSRIPITINILCGSFGGIGEYCEILSKKYPDIVEGTPFRQLVLEEPVFDSTSYMLEDFLFEETETQLKADEHKKGMGDGKYREGFLSIF